MLVDEEEAPVRNVPPVRRGSRDERREATVRALADGREAHCAYCGHPLPPLSPRGGRPTPYCVADPERYGQWGAKVISCAMLDEHREIWVTVYGADQPMTSLDTQALETHLSGALTALNPLTEQIDALRTHITGQTTAALAAQADAEAARDVALEKERVARAEQAGAMAAAEHAVAEAEAARQRAEADHVELVAAAAMAAQAVKDRDDAIAARDEADRTRQRALEQVTATQDRIAALQTELAGERISALDRLEHANRAADRAQQALRAELEHRLREQAEAFDARAQAIQESADQRIAQFTATRSTRNWLRKPPAQKR